VAGWRFVNKLMQQQYGCYSAAQSAENVAREFGISRQAQDDFAFRSHSRTQAAQRSGFFEAEITPVTATNKDDEPVVLTEDELQRDVSLASLARMPTVADGGSVTEATLCGMHDGACALLLACEKTAQTYSLLPRARVIAMASAGVPPRISDMGAASAARRALVQAGLALEQMEVIELHESSAASCLAVLRDWGLGEDEPRVNPNGGALAIGHPPGASGARLVITAINELHRIKGRYALCAMSAEVGQGIALIIERV
jgi:acetyl-CoA acetyltransferase family protein